MGEHGNMRSRLSQLAERSDQLGTLQQSRLRTRRVMRCKASGGARRAGARTTRRPPQNARERFNADGARTKQRGLAVGAVDDGRFDAVLARPAVEDHRNLVSELV